MEYRIDVIARELCFEGFLKVARYRIRHSGFAGGWSEIFVRERIEFLNSAAAILYDAVSDRVVLVEQFRIGALEDGVGAWTLEPVGGIVGAGEKAGDVVRREALEEAGCEISNLVTIGTYHVSPGTAADRVHLFCGCVDSKSARGVHGLHAENEETRVVVIDFQQAAKQLFSGKLNTSTAILSIQWLAMNRDRLRAEWNP